MTEAAAQAAGPAEPGYWTIAYRKRTAPFFHRVQDWSGDWDAALEMARSFNEQHPDLQVWYLPTFEAEVNGYVVMEDIGHVMTDSGKRIPIHDDGTIDPDGQGVHQPNRDAVADRLARRDARLYSLDRSERALVQAGLAKLLTDPAYAPQASAVAALSGKVR